MNRQHIILAVGVVSVSFAALFVRLAQAPPLIIAAYRLCLASLLLDPVALMRSRNELRRLSRRDVFLMLLSGTFLALHFGLWITSLSYTSVATSVVLVTVSPIFVAIASYLLFGERLSGQTIVGIAACILGATLVTYGNWRLGPGPLFGGVLALLGALAVAGYMLIGRRLRQSLGLLSYSSIVYSSAGLLLLISAIALRYPLFGYSTGTYMMLLLLAVVPQLLGHTSLNWSLRFVSATLVTVAVLGEPVGATLWAFLFLGEVPALTEVVGGTLILIGIVVAFREREIALHR
ncbi:MAG: DMT family transporter [Chloroflexi bacterium]|nr:DMT family transporter [Chloroflexota bacterium]